MQMWSRFFNSTVVDLPLHRGFPCCSSQSISPQAVTSFYTPITHLTMYKMLWNPVSPSCINHWALLTHYSTLFFALFLTSTDKLQKTGNAQKSTEFSAILPFTFSGNKPTNLSYLKTEKFTFIYIILPPKIPSFLWGYAPPAFLQGQGL